MCGVARGVPRGFRSCVCVAMAYPGGGGHVYGQGRIQGRRSVSVVYLWRTQGVTIPHYLRNEEGAHPLGARPRQQTLLMMAEHVSGCWADNAGTNDNNISVFCL